MKKKLAIIAPSDTPIPSVLGGAVETLTTYLLDENEKKAIFNIDVYTVKNDKLDTYKYKFTKIVQIKKQTFSTLYKLFCSLLNKFNYYVKFNKRFFYFDKHIAKSVNYNNNYDFILVENNMNVFEYVLRFRKGNEKLFFHLHNDVIDSPYKSIRLCKLVYENCEKVFCASNYLLDRFNFAVGGDVHNKNILLTNCINLDFFNMEKISGESLRNKFEFDSNVFVILFSGRITREKGLLELVEAIKSLDRNLNIKCLIIGDTWFSSRQEKQYLKSIMAKVTGDNRFCLLGRVNYSEMAKYYQISDLTIIPSLWQEPFGMVALESLASGCPIAVTKRGGLQYIPNHTCGTYIDETNGIVEGIKKAILENVHLSSSLGFSRRVAAYRRAREAFYGPDRFFDIIAKEINDV